MKIKIYIGLNYVMRINTQFKNILTSYTKSDILTKRLGLLPDWDKICILFTKRLHIMNKITGYLLQEPLRTAFNFMVHIKQMTIYNL